MAKTSLGTSVYGPDPSYVEGLSNIASMFDPKAQAAGALSQAHTDYYGHQAALADAQARLNAAKAAAAEDQNSAYADDAAMAAAGYSPAERIAARMTRTNSMADLFKGRNLYAGGQAIANGDPYIGALLTGQGSALTKNYAPTQDIANSNAARDNDLATQKGIAVAQGTPRNVGIGQTLTTTNPDGTVNELFNAPINVAPGHIIVQPTATGGAVPVYQSPVTSGSKDHETSPFNQNEVDKVRNQIRDILHVGSGDKAQYPNDADVVYPIINKAQELIKQHKSTQSTAVSDAFAEMGYNMRPNTVVTPGTNWPIVGKVGGGSEQQPTPEPRQPVPSASVSAVPQSAPAAVNPAVVAPPAGAIQMLKANPGLKSQFDAKYGQGASNLYLGQ